MTKIAATMVVLIDDKGEMRFEFMFSPDLDPSITLTNLFTYLQQSLIRQKKTDESPKDN